MLNEIINRVHNLNHDQQKDIIDYLRALQKGQQREYPRLNNKTNIDAVVDGKVIQSDTKNISASGVYINTTDKIEIDKDAMIVFTIPGHDNTFKLKGRVVRTEPDGIAIRFENMTPYSKGMLNELLLKRTSDNDQF